MITSGLKHVAVQMACICGEFRRFQAYFDCATVTKAGRNNRSAIV